MTNSIFISKVLYKVLSDDVILNKSIENRIYPLIAENDTKFPFITFSRDSIITNSCKDGYFEDTVSFTVIVASANYIGSLDIANRVRALLERRKIETQDLTLYDVKLTSIDEAYSDNAYIQKLSFECTVNN